VPSSELTQVRVSGVSGAVGGDMTSGALGAGVPRLAVLPAGAVPAGAVPAGRGGGVRIAASKRLNASLVSPASASAAPAN
jgi:hypothetical protein